MGIGSVRAFDDNGKVIGSKMNEFGKIFINPLTWAVRGHVAEGEYARKCLDAYTNT